MKKTLTPLLALLSLVFCLASCEKEVPYISDLSVKNKADIVMHNVARSSGGIGLMPDYVMKRIRYHQYVACDEQKIDSMTWSDSTTHSAFQADITYKNLCGPWATPMGKVEYLFTGDGTFLGDEIQMTSTIWGRFSCHELDTPLFNYEIYANVVRLGDGSIILADQTHTFSFKLDIELQDIIFDEGRKVITSGSFSGVLTGRFDGRRNFSDSFYITFGGSRRVVLKLAGVRFEFDW
jgi:hypothetical protein